MAILNELYFFSLDGLVDTIVQIGESLLALFENIGNKVLELTGPGYGPTLNSIWEILDTNLILFGHLLHSEHPGERMQVQQS